MAYCGESSIVWVSIPVVPFGVPNAVPSESSTVMAFSSNVFETCNASIEFASRSLLAVLRSTHDSKRSNCSSVNGLSRGRLTGTRIRRVQS